MSSDRKHEPESVEELLQRAAKMWLARENAKDGQVGALPMGAPRRDCDCSQGDVQCLARLPHDDGYLNCRFVGGHGGSHQTGYVNGQEWTEDVDGARADSVERLPTADEFYEGDWLKSHPWPTNLIVTKQDGLDFAEACLSAANARIAELEQALFDKFGSGEAIQWAISHQRQTGELEALQERLRLSGERIAELERDSEMLRRGCIVEIAVENNSVAEYVRHWEGRAISAEERIAELEKQEQKNVEMDADCAIAAEDRIAKLTRALEQIRRETTSSNIALIVNAALSSPAAPAKDGK